MPANIAQGTPASRDDLYTVFDAHNIAYETHEHPPIFTVQEGADIKSSIPGGHTKNLFLKDKAGAYFLICALGETQIKINRLHPLLGCKRLSFGKEEYLYAHLGVRPGSVTLFSIINDPDQAVTLILDAALLKHSRVNFHPLENTATTGISSEDMLRFIKAMGRAPILVDFSDFDAPQIRP